MVEDNIHQRQVKRIQYRMDVIFDNGDTMVIFLGKQIISLNFIFLIGP